MNKRMDGWIGFSCDKGIPSNGCLQDCVKQKEYLSLVYVSFDGLLRTSLHVSLLTTRGWHCDNSHKKLSGISKILLTIYSHSFEH